jgi:hypothetical protein
MALIRGYGGLCPCPICLVKKEKLADLAGDYELRTAAKTQEIIQEANTLRTMLEKENKLKEYSLRDVHVGLIC